MTKIAVMFTLMIFSLMLFMPFTLNMDTAQAQTGYSIQNVTHNVSVLYSGHIIISDTFQISGTMPNNLQVGFPFQYGTNIINAEAYDANNNELPITLGVPLQDRSGFYAATVNLPSGTTNTFTVVFIFENNLVTPTPTGYSLNYPAYPSLAAGAASVTTNLTLPAGATIREIVKADGAINVTTYTKSNLAEFTSMQANATFNAASDTLQKSQIPQLDRNINISPAGAVTCTDNYRIINNAANSLSFFKLNIPRSATNIQATDLFGRILSVSTRDISANARVANITFVTAVGTGDSVPVTVTYDLPSVTLRSGQFILETELYPYFNYYVDALTVIVVPPEGATIVAPSAPTSGDAPIVSRSAFQETLSVTRAGITYINKIYQSHDTLQVIFNYNPLWIAFRPTLWAWVIAAVGVAVAAFLLRPKTKTVPSKVSPPITTTTAVSADQIRAFIEAYEEKLQSINDLKSLEARAQHGRIPRRRYKLQRTTLETRLTVLNKTIGNLKNVLSRSGGSHAAIVRQLETAEVNLNEANLKLTTLETRHTVGELSLEDYKKQLTDLEKRKQKAESTINGLLLRLRGEIS